jgi:hypothetical protein
MIGNAVVLHAVYTGRCADFNSAIFVNRDDLQASCRVQEVVVCWMRLGLREMQYLSPGKDMLHFSREQLRLGEPPEPCPDLKMTEVRGLVEKDSVTCGLPKVNKLATDLPTPLAPSLSTPPLTPLSSYDGYKAKLPRLLMKTVDYIFS